MCYSDKWESVVKFHSKINDDQVVVVALECECHGFESSHHRSQSHFRSSHVAEILALNNAKVILVMKTENTFGGILF